MLGLPVVLLALAPPPSPAARVPQDDPRRTPVVEVVERVKPAVVSITTDILVEEGWPFRRVVPAKSSGTGVLVYEDGFLITNYHVVRGATAIEVHFDASDDARAYEAALVAFRPEEDLALLKIDGDKPFPIVKISHDEALLGEPVVAIGNAYGRSHTVSTGIVSGLHRTVDTPDGVHFENLLQTDASINPGNSGGPLLNIHGELIGINTAMQNSAENIGFAIPVEHVKKVLSEQLLAPGQAPAYLGFEIDEDTMNVRSVVPSSPAALAGIQVGDRLLTLAGQLLHSVDGKTRDVYRLVRLGIKPYANVPFTLKRGTLEQELELVAWDKSDGILLERLGLGLETIRLQTSGFGHRGAVPFLRVTLVQPDGPAAKASLAVGDILWTIQTGRGRETWFQDPADLAYVLERLRPGDELGLQIYRDIDGDEVLLERDPATGYTELFRGKLTLR